MNHYIYDGPVKVFETCVTSHWHGETMAVSEEKARSNLAYQYKKSHGRSATSKITLLPLAPLPISNKHNSTLLLSLPSY